MLIQAYPEAFEKGDRLAARRFSSYRRHQRLPCFRGFSSSVSYSALFCCTQNGYESFVRDGVFMSVLLVQRPSADLQHCFDPQGPCGTSEGFGAVRGNHEE